MRIRATLTLRNEAIIAARERAGVSQKDVAMAIGVSIETYARVEKLDFSTPAPVNAAKLAAEFFQLDEPEVIPDALIGEKVQNKMRRVATIDAQRLLASPIARPERYILPSPETAAMETEASEIIDDAMEALTWRQRQVVDLRYGLHGKEAHTFLEIGQEFKITQERVRQIELRALGKLQNPSHLNPINKLARDRENKGPKQ